MKSQNGNVVFIILIAMVMFAALSYAVTRSTRVSTDMGGSEKLSLDVTELMSGASAISTAVKTVMAGNNCLETQINFYSPLLANASQFANAAAPADKSCNIFDVNGGGLAFSKLNKKLFDTDFTTSSTNWDWLFEGSRCIRGVGTGITSCPTSNENELVAFLPYIRKDICVAINAKFNIVQSGYDVPVEGFSTERFSGSFAYIGASIGSASTATALRDKPIGCFRSSFGGTANSYVFYYTLLAR